MRRIPTTQVYSILDPAHFKKSIERDLAALWNVQAFPSSITLIVCFLDTFAANGGEATKKKFVDFVEARLPQLCRDLKTSTGSNKSGGTIFYEEFRNGLAHLSAPRSGPNGKFGLDRSSNMPNSVVEEIQFEDGSPGYALNVDRFYADFLGLLDRMWP